MQCNEAAVSLAAVCWQVCLQLSAVCTCNHGIALSLSHSMAQQRCNAACVTAIDTPAVQSWAATQQRSSAATGMAAARLTHDGKGVAAAGQMRIGRGTRSTAPSRQPATADATAASRQEGADIVSAKETHTGNIAAHSMQLGLVLLTCRHTDVRQHIQVFVGAPRPPHAHWQTET